MAESNRQQDEELLTAYLDGELDSEQRVLAETLIQQNPKYAQLIEEWRENGIALRSLPKHRLDSGFSARVLAAKEITSSPTVADVATLKSNSAMDQSAQANPINGLIAIAALAAMVLLTLFVFPMFVDSTNLATNDPIVENDKTAAQNSDNNSTDLEKGRTTPPIQRVDRAKMLTARSPAGSVDPIKTLHSNLAAVEQVFWIKLDGADQSLAGLQKVLAANSIKIVDSEKDFSKTEDVSAIYVVASALQMRKAIGKLSEESSSSVTAFPLPLSAIQNGKAQQLLPVNLSGDAQQATEIAELDRWFGLSGDEEEDRPIRFLLLVGSE